MKTAKDILIEGLKEMGADGLYNPWVECGCGINDLEPCNDCDLSECRPARLGKEDGLYYLLEEQ